MTFQQHITAALSNPTLQSALDRNAARRIAARAEAFAALPEADAVRDRARAIRLETLTHLDHYLEQFTDRLTENGVIVHRAQSAIEASQIVVALAQERGVELAAKSKSMVSEEIELNHALLAAGVQPVETDLGEFIVQIRGERPSHIITPAVHLRREDVARTFQQKLNMDPADDGVPAMTALARRHLRQTFLNAGMGLSGVNFGVAETGTLCIVTNEGNGRMVTGLPPIHVALMGLERLVPTPEDLEILLRVLPRSATSQKLTVYTTLLNGPRRPGEPDGPDELHLVLLDNGRSRVRRGELAEALLCIRCGACLNACPVYREIGGHAYGGVYPGPIGSVLAPAVGGAADFGHLAQASTLCGACMEACPVHIDLPSMLLHLRGQHVRQAPQPAWLAWGMKAFAWVMQDPARYRQARSLAGALTRWLARDGWLRQLPGPLSQWTMNRDFPAFPRETFRERLARRRGEQPAPPPRPLPPHPHPGPLPDREVQPGPDPAPRQDRAPTADSGRDSILSRLRGVSVSIPASAALPLPPPAGEADFEALSARFAAELAALGGVFRCVPADKLAQTVVELLAERGARSVFAWVPEMLPLPGLCERLRREGVAVLGPMVSPAGPDRRAGLADRAAAAVGLTGCEAALAETGSLVMRAGPGRGRLASLLPPVHIALVRPEQFFPSLAAYLAHHRLRGSLEALFREPSSLTVISGPSRTADIEMTLTIGVHGPGELHVLCIRD